MPSARTPTGTTSTPAASRVLRLSSAPDGTWTVPLGTLWPGSY